MNAILLPLFALLASAMVVRGEYSAPEAKPVIGISEASSAAMSFLKNTRWARDAYVDRAILIKDRKRVWVIWVASTLAGYQILEVGMDGKVKTATPRHAAIAWRHLAGP